MKNENRSGEFLKTLFLVIGVIASISALALVAYSLFKKYFQVTFDCGDEGERFDADDEDYFADEDDEPFEPILCCDEGEEEAEPEDEAESVVE